MPPSSFFPPYRKTRSFLGPQFHSLASQDQDRGVAGYGSGSGASRQQNLSIRFHQVLVDRHHCRISIRLCRRPCRFRHKETDADYQDQHNRGHDTDHSFPRAVSRGPHREESFRRRRCSLSFMISLKSATGRSSTGPSPYLKPGSCEISWTA